MSDKAFLDTNILVYAIEQDGSEKSAFALELVRRGEIYISTQVLGEFYNAVTNSRRALPLTHAEAVAWIQLWKKHHVSVITLAHVDLALEIKERYQLHYYDALILASARLAGIAVVYFEDMADGQDYNGVTVTNPFCRTT